jgi:hypothetical protein
MQTRDENSHDFVFKMKIFTDDRVPSPSSHFKYKHLYTFHIQFILTAQNESGISENKAEFSISSESQRSSS